MFPGLIFTILMPVEMQINTLQRSYQMYNFTLTVSPHYTICLLYTSDAADEEDSVDLGGRRIIKKKIANSPEFKK